ncbi:MAG: hypothetical protein K8R59_10910, partial [Thermoanaerobaculales bacterium]|nr:hypothetical protein [Thermoanaerobaculales bacterium]
METNRIRRFVLPYFDRQWFGGPESGLFRGPGLLAHLKVRQRRFVCGPNGFALAERSAENELSRIPGLPV